MSDLKPTVCGDPNLYAPEAGCSDCEELELRVRTLEECCAEVQVELPKKLEIQNILAGDNITIEEDGEGNILISSTGGGGGGCTCTKSEILNCIGVREMPMSLTDTQGNKSEYLVLGRLKSETIGDGNPISSCDCTKQELLDILGYEEIDISMTDEDSTEIWTLIGKPKYA